MTKDIDNIQTAQSYVDAASMFYKYTEICVGVPAKLAKYMKPLLDKVMESLLRLYPAGTIK